MGQKDSPPDVGALTTNAIEGGTISQKTPSATTLPPGKLVRQDASANLALTASVTSGRDKEEQNYELTQEVLSNWVEDNHDKNDFNELCKSIEDNFPGAVINREQILNAALSSKNLDPEQKMQLAKSYRNEYVSSSLEKLLARVPPVDSFQESLDLIHNGISRDIPNFTFDEVKIAEQITLLTESGGKYENRPIHEQGVKAILNNNVSVMHNQTFSVGRGGQTSTHSVMKKDFATLEKFWKATDGEKSAAKKKEYAKRVVHKQDRFWKDGTCLLSNEVQKEIFGNAPISRIVPKKTKFASISKGVSKKLKLEKHKEYVLDQLVQFIQRPTVEVKVGTSTYEQAAGHYQEVDGKGEFSNTTDSSITLKDGASDEHLAHVNANSAYVKTSDNQYIAGRSARSDTPGRILDLVQTNCFASMGSENQPGLTLNDDGTYTYLLSITSGQDRSIAKETAAKTGWGENEVSSIRDIEQSIDDLWPSDDPLIMMIDGKEVKVLKPLFKTQVLSGEGKRPLVNVIPSNREANRKIADREFQLLKNEMKPKEGDSPELKMLSDIFDHDDFPESVPDNFKNGEVFTQINAMANGKEKTVLMKRYFALEAVCVNATGRTLEGEPMEKSGDKTQDALNQGKVMMFDMYLHEVLNIAEAYQCKSGCDRTLTLMSMKTALHEFEKSNGRPFNPMCMKGELCKTNDKDHNSFASIFRGVAKGFGENILMPVRGKMEVKWDHHIVPRLFYDSTLKDPIPGLKGLKAGKGESDTTVDDEDDSEDQEYDLV